MEVPYLTADKNDSITPFLPLLHANDGSASGTHLKLSGESSKASSAHSSCMGWMRYFISYIIYCLLQLFHKDLF